MKIIYETNQNVYGVRIEPSETVTILNTDDIVEAREEFISKMKWLFNEAIRKKLKYNPGEDSEDTEASTNKTCKSEEDHEWECCGMSTAGSDYRCKKCGKYKFEPYTESTSNYYKGE